VSNVPGETLLCDEALCLNVLLSEGLGAASALKRRIAMVQWFRSYGASVIDVLGVTLLLVGLFLPWSMRTTPPEIQDVWHVISSSFQDFFPHPFFEPWKLLVPGAFLLPPLLQLLTAVGGFRGKGNRIVCLLTLVCALLGLAAFSEMSTFFLSYALKFDQQRHITRSLGYGTWVMGSGFLLIIGSSIAHLWPRRKPPMQWTEVPVPAGR
jgi:hypothetical protein